MPSREQLQQAAADRGFQVESYEKVHVLVRLLEAIRTHPFLGPRMALKGGTALNLFVLGLPRLSVDIDLNYVGALDRETMLAERPRVERALEQVAGRTGLTIKRAPTEHAGGKWRLTYATALARQESIEVDVNFMLRTPLWPAAPRNSHPIGGEKATQVLTVEDHELAAGKLAALAAQRASRDVFDAREIMAPCPRSPMRAARHSSRRTASRPCSRMPHARCAFCTRLRLPKPNWPTTVLETHTSGGFDGAQAIDVPERTDESKGNRGQDGPRT